MSAFHRGDWIGLAQAVGGMLAVVAAFLVSWLQSRSDARLRRSDMLGNLEALAKVIELAKDRADELRLQIMVAPANVGIKFASIPQIQKINVAFDALEAISINNAPSAKSVAALIDAKTAIKHSVGIIPGRLHMIGETGQFFVSHEDELKRIVGLLADAELQIRSEWLRLAGKSEQRRASSEGSRR